MHESGRARNPQNVLAHARRTCDDAAVKRDIDPRKCANCEGVYEPAREWQRFCCKGCRDEGQIAERREAYRLLRDARSGEARA